MELAEEFLDRYRKGERPPLKEYIGRHPELAAEIKEVFPAMAMMENIAVADESLEERGQGSGGRGQEKPALQQLGDYRIIREIGHGGMGVVYEAEQVSLGRHVALKVLPDKALLDAKHKRRFEREARAAAKLHHTNIVPVFGVGEHNGLPYYVMQFIQGLGLDAVLDELQHMKPGAAHAPSGLPTAGAIRISRRDISAADVARSLMTGAFESSVNDEPAVEASPRSAPVLTEALPAQSGMRDEGEGMSQKSTVPSPHPSSLIPHPSSLIPHPSSSLSGSFTVSSSSLTLPASGTGPKAASKKQSYWQSVANIGRQVADGLEYAHNQGILHRDIKPSNLLLDLRGTVWVTDFGLAKVAGPGADGDNLTHTGDILGTLRYMPPEAFEGKSDARGDVYSLGLTLYEMLTLRPAFGEKDRHKLIKLVTGGEPAALDTVSREIPRDLVTVIQKAIDRDPNRRYASAGAFASDLQRFLDDEPILARRQTQLERYVRWARHNPGMAVLGAVLTAVLVLVTVGSLLVAGRMSTLAQSADAEAEKARKNAEQAKQSQRETETALTQVKSQKAELEAQKAAVQNSLTKAEKSEQAARAAEEQGRRLLYATDMQLAPFIWNDPRATAAQLRSRLDAHDPEKNKSLAGKDDLRGFEWHYYKHLLENSSAVFRANAAAISDLALTDDGQLVTLDQQARLKHWDPDTHLEAASSNPGVLSRVPRVCALSPDRKRLALAAGKTVEVRDATTGVVMYHFESKGTFESKDAIPDLIFSQDGRFLVTYVRNWVEWFDAGNGRAIAAAQVDYGRAGISLSFDGLTLAVCGLGNIGNAISILRLDPAANKVSLQPQALGTGGTINTAVLSPDGKLIAVGSAFSGVAAVYDTARRVQIGFHGSAHASAVSAIAFSRNGLNLATADVEGVIKTWGDARKLTSNSEPQRTLKGHAGAINKVAFSNTGKELVSAGQDGTVRIWPLEQSLSASRRLSSSHVDPVFFADGLLIATAEGNHVTIWDAASGQRLRSLAEGGEILSIAISPDSRLLAVGSYTKAGNPLPNRRSFLSLWEIDSGRRLAEFTGMNDGFLEGHYAYCTVQTLAFSADGRFLVAGFGSRQAHFENRTIDLKVWDVASRREAKRLLGHTNACVSICFSADGTKMASGSHDGTARVWDTATWHAAGRPFTAGDPNNSVEAVAFSPDGDTLAMGTMGGNILLGNLVTRERVALPKAHANSVHCVAFSPDGRTLASGSWDETVRLWNVATGRELMVLSSKDLKLGSVWSLSFSPDGTQLLAGGASAAVVWSAPPSGWDNPTWTAKKLEPLLRADAVFQERIRTASESQRLRQALAALQVLHPDDKRVQAALAATQANWLASRQAWPEAVAAFERLRAAEPTTPEVWLRTRGLVRLATALLQQNRSRDAAALLAGHAKRRAQDGLAAGARQEFDPLFAAINERLSPLAPHPSPLMLELRAELAGQWSDAKAQVADYTAAIEALSKQTGKPTTPDIQRLYGRRGIAYVGLEKWPEAVADFAHVITRETTDVDLLSNRARAYEGRGNWDAAVADWSRAAAASPQGAKLLADFARRLAAVGQVPLANGQFAKAQALYERTLAAHPENDLVATELAQLLWNKHDHGNSAAGEHFWIDDAAPSGARLSPWEWVSKPDYPVFRGQKATRLRATGLSQHGFDEAAARLKIGHGAKLFAYVFLDPKDPPKTVMLQFKVGNSWDHRAFWGEDRMTEWGTQGKESRLAMGPLPKVGEWVRVEVDAARVGLRPGAELNGWAFTQYAGTCYWDAAGGTNCTLSFDSPWLTLAAAYALTGRKDEAVHYFGMAIQRADGYEARKPILEFARQLDDVLSALVERQPDDLELQLALARRLAERGKQGLADKQPAAALAELQKARTIFTRLRAEAQWKVLTPTELKANGGEKLTVENDGSIFVSGPNPDRAVYTLKLRSDLPTLTAIRLETIPDARLPQGGAGRAGGGNFHLADLTAAIESGHADAKPTPIDFTSAISDNWSGSDSQHAPARIIDNNPETFWHTDPREAHWAVLGLKSPAPFNGGSLSMTLDSGMDSRDRWRKHGLGRFRLSVTNQAEAVLLAELRSDLKDSEVMDVSVALAKAHAQQGHIDEAVASFAEALDLAADRAGKAKVITEAAPLAGVLERLAERPVKDNAGRLAFAQVFYDRRKFAASARLWAEALASDPKLADDRQAQHRYHAARAATLAAAGQSKDEPPLDDAAKAKLRRQALDWLKAELTVWTKHLASAPPEDRPTIVETLSRWQKDSDLAGIRDKAALAKLPADERAAFTELWVDVAALLEKAQSPATKESKK